LFSIINGKVTPLGRILSPVFMIVAFVYCVFNTRKSMKAVATFVHDNFNLISTELENAAIN
jgi:hypothetical protein